MDNEYLYKIDIIRERLGISYNEAKQALDEAGGDVVTAIINLEQKENISDEQSEPKLKKLAEQIRLLLKKGNVTKIKIKKKDKVITEIPATVGAVGIMAMLVSTPIAIIAGLGGIAAMMNDYKLEVVKKDGTTEEHDIEE